MQWFYKFSFGVFNVFDPFVASMYKMCLTKEMHHYSYQVQKLIQILPATAKFKCIHHFHSIPYFLKKYKESKTVLTKKMVYVVSMTTWCHYIIVLLFYLYEAELNGKLEKCNKRKPSIYFGRILHCGKMH